MPDDGVLYPICPRCNADPLEFRRLRYDFPDGLLVETFFCSACRVLLSAQIAGVERKKQEVQ